MRAATTRHEAVATRNGSEGRAIPRAHFRPGLSALCKPAGGSLLRGADRLAPIPAQLKPYVGPESRSQFGSRIHSPAKVVRGGRR